MSTHALQAHIEACELLIGYTFADKTILGRALNASGNAVMMQGARIGDNKALAIFGDTAMTALLCRQWLATGTNRGVWDSVRKSVLGNDNLANAGFTTGLQACITTYALTTVSAKMMASTVEAIAAAAYLDGGEDAMAAVMRAMQLTDSRLEIAATLVPLPSLAFMPCLTLGINNFQKPR